MIEDKLEFGAVLIKHHGGIHAIGISISHHFEQWFIEVELFNHFLRIGLIRTINDKKRFHYEDWS